MSDLFKKLDKLKSNVEGVVGQIDVDALKSEAAAIGSIITDKVGEKVDVEDVKSKAASLGSYISEKAGDVRDVAIDIKDDINEKLTELDRMLSQTITEYNDAFTLMNDKGLQLYLERTRAVDIINHTEALINSIANHPKSIDSDFEEIKLNRNTFSDTCSFADRELQAARNAAGGAGAGLAAGASVAFMAPTAAIWVATTFGTASTGTAISALSGAAATNAALAWLGGGAVAAGGGGVVAGNALLALAGPIGWSIAGATLLTSIILFASKRNKLNKEKNEEIEAVKNNIVIVKQMDAEIDSILQNTIQVRDALDNIYTQNLSLFGNDYSIFTDEQKHNLGALVNTAKSLSVLFTKTLETATEK